MDESPKGGNPHADNPRNRAVHKVRSNHSAVRALAPLAKLCLNLAILVALATLAWFCSDVFMHGSASQTEAIQNSALIIAGIVVIALLIKLSTRGKFGDTQPRLPLTVLSVIGIGLILGFAGVEPMAHYLYQFSMAIDPWLSWARLGLGIGFLVALINPFYVLVFIGILVWIIYMVRHW